MAETVLELEQLEVAYDGVLAVRGLSLTVARGEIVGLIGPNGAGKTTTLRAIMGLVRPAGGDVRLAGRSLRGRAPERIARAGVALVPEGRRIYPHLTVDENLRLGLAARRRGGQSDILESLRELFPVLGRDRKRPGGLLSGGEQQQLAIARALAAEPDVLLLDEPSLGLAPTLVDVVFERLAQIRARGVTTVLVEQRAQRTVAFADRTYALANGELKATFTPADASDTDRMVAAYFG
ncbi:MAG: ABC transporter ATP-binding protein [Gaiellaceae bacterium]